MKQEMSVFNTIPKSDWLFETVEFFAIYDKYPTSNGHLLIISKECVHDYFELSGNQKQDLIMALEKGREMLQKIFAPDGYNIGMNCGEAAGQTVFHFHCHIIPRYIGDIEDPRGGVRHAVIGKGYY